MTLESDIDQLVERQEPGRTLEQVFYRSPEIYELEFRRVLSPQWLYVAHESELPEFGDFVAYDIAEDSIIVVRGLDGEVRAFFNVCRHRGSQICLEKSGNTRLPWNAAQGN